MRSYCASTDSYYWSCQTKGNEVEIRFGTVGSAGRRITKCFDFPRDARAYCFAKVSEKRRSGDYRSPTANKKRKSVPVSALSAAAGISANVVTPPPSPEKKHPRKQNKTTTKQAVTKENKNEEDNDIGWYHYVHNDTHGRPNGWHKCDEQYATEVEEFYQMNLEAKKKIDYFSAPQTTIINDDEKRIKPIYPKTQADQSAEPKMENHHQPCLSDIGFELIVDI